MNFFKYDTHVHTSETSPCGKVSGLQVARVYKEAGYDGIVITDHYYKDFFDKYGNISWEDKIDEFLKGYKSAYEEGGRIGLQVLLGIEIRFTENPNDYLVFGISEQFLKSNEALYHMGLEGFKTYTKDQGILIFQAHPFRKNMIPADPILVDGIEVYNGNPRHNSRNDQAHAYALNHQLKMMSGSDFHQLEDLARGGVILSESIGRSSELVSVINNEGIVDFMSAD